MQSRFVGGPNPSANFARFCTLLVLITIQFDLDNSWKSIFREIPGFHFTHAAPALSPLASVRIETWHGLVGFQPLSSLLKSNSYERFGSIYLAYLQRYPKRAHRSCITHRHLITRSFDHAFALSVRHLISRVRLITRLLCLSGMQRCHLWPETWKRRFHPLDPSCVCLWKSFFVVCLADHAR